MLKCDLRALLKENNVSKYSLVVACAKRAREIADEAERDGVQMTEKTVSVAIDEFFAGKYRIEEDLIED